MAVMKWVTVARKQCDVTHREVELRELRVYSTTDTLTDFTGNYRVRACACTAAVDCNMAGVSCKWAYNAPDSDRF